jgi:hypothetical protein
MWHILEFCFQFLLSWKTLVFHVQRQGVIHRRFNFFERMSPSKDKWWIYNLWSFLEFHLKETIVHNYVHLQLMNISWHTYLPFMKLEKYFLLDKAWHITFLSSHQWYLTLGVVTFNHTTNYQETHLYPQQCHSNYKYILATCTFARNTMDLYLPNT